MVGRKSRKEKINLIRRERAEKRGGLAQREELGDDLASGPEGNVQVLLDLRAALETFEQFDPDGALLVRFRHFLGCTFEECAELLRLSKTETIRIHKRALLWLKRELKGYDLDA